MNGTCFSKATARHAADRRLRGKRCVWPTMAVFSVLTALTCGCGEDVPSPSGQRRSLVSDGAPDAKAEFKTEAAPQPKAQITTEADLRPKAEAREGAGAWADLVGRFVYVGPPPERAKLKVDKDVECCGKFDVRDESLLVDANGGVANIFVYVRNRNVEVCPELLQAAPKHVKLDNKDCIFIPHCTAIWCKRQEFHIVNSDPVAQNVAFSPLGEVPTSAVLPAAKPGGKRDVPDAKYVFSIVQIVPVPIACSYHPWESAYILPRDNPYVAISRPDGTFRIAKLPVGRLEFQAWHERVGYLDSPEWPKGRFEIVIRPGENDVGTVRLTPNFFAKK